MLIGEMSHPIGISKGITLVYVNSRSRDLQALSSTARLVRVVGECGARRADSLRHV